MARANPIVSPLTTTAAACRASVATESFGSCFISLNLLTVLGVRVYALAALLKACTSLKSSSAKHGIVFCDTQSGSEKINWIYILLAEALLTSQPVNSFLLALAVPAKPFK